MTTDEAMLHPGGPQDLADCCTLLVRLIRLDAAGVVRLQHAGNHVTLWAQPLGVVVRREVRARLGVADRTVSAAELLAAVDDPAGGSVRLPLPNERAWRVSLPPRTGWSILDEVPVEVLQKLADNAGRLVRAAEDPAAAGESLLDQEAVRVSRGAEEVVLPMRVVTVLNRMGFLGPHGQLADVVRVACTPTWTRVAARHGTAYERRSGLTLRPA